MTDPIAIVAVGARLADGRDTKDLIRTLLLGDQAAGPDNTAPENREGAELSWALPTATAAVRGVRLPAGRTLLAGAIPETVAARLELTGPRLRVPPLPPEDAAGLAPLEAAARALGNHEADAALVGTTHPHTVMLVLKRLPDARHDGDRVMALLDEPGSPPDLLVDPAELFGTDTADGLLAVATAALCLHHRAVPRPGRPAAPALRSQPTAAITAVPAQVRLRAGDAGSWLAEPSPRPHVYSGQDRREVLAALAAGRESGRGPARLVVMAADGEQHTTRAAAARAWLTGEGPPVDGVAFRETPIDGEVAFVYTNGAAAYPGMGRALMLAFPSIMDELEARCGSLPDVAGWAYTDAATGSVHALDQMWGAGLLGLLHTEITRELLGISPSAVIGYSSGELNAFVAMRAWRDIPALVTDVRGSDLFTHALTGEFEAVRKAWKNAGVAGDRWASYLVGASAEELRTALAGEPAVHVMAVNSPDSCVLGGEATGCERVLRRLGPNRALPMDYEIAVHVPELAEIAEQWRRLHHRPTHEVPGVRFYSCATTASYPATPEAAANAMTTQALGTVDFAGTIDRAWADGVRVFIEHGPRALCTGWTRRVLGDREHLAVAMDARDVRQLANTVAELLAAGVRMDTGSLFDRLAPPDEPEPEPPAAETMRRAPQLPPVLAAPASPLAEPEPSAPVTVHTAVSTTSQLPLTVAGRHHQRVSLVHQDFLTLQAEVHQRFLHSRRLAETVLSRTPGTPRPVGSPPAASSAPARPGFFDRAALERFADGPVSAVFGTLFAAQDDYPKQTRLPRPPMLMVDRVTAIDAEPGVLALGNGTSSAATGTIRTETDVRLDGWYLDATGRLPVGLMVEAGQGNLLLMTWLGIDLLNRGERVYRLIGGELTFHGGPPVAGETLSYENHIDGHGEHDGMRLAFFHCEARIGGELRLSVRDGVLGFFTEDELASSGGVLWDPEAEPCDDSEPLDPPAAPCTASRFGPDAVRAFAEGRPADCFGPGWELTRSHVRSPRISGGRLLALHEVIEFDPAGGPWRRGYLRAEAPVDPDAWFFEGHFKNDPCMPGSLMFEGCLQAMAFYLAAAGFTIERDAWRFEPVPGRPYRMHCRSQVTPENHRLTYEVFVSGLSAAEQPTLIADVLCSVDGVKALHVRGVGLRLVPDWPLDHWRRLGPPAEQTTGELVAPQLLAGLRGHREPSPVAEVDGFAFGYPAFLAYGLGKPSEALGPVFARLDGPHRIPRHPAPPFGFISRIVSVEGPIGQLRAGASVVAEYDVPPEVWYFEQNGYPAMPFCVLMEVALQTCGWLGSYVGSGLTADGDLLVRNLDGTGTATGEVRPGTQTLRTRAELRQVSRSGGVIIESFTVECFADDRPVFRLSTLFGYFPPEAFENQPGLTPSPAELVQLSTRCARSVDLTTRPVRYFEGTLRLAGPMLLMLDRVTGYWPRSGKAGLGRLRAERDIDPGEWIFKAHFFQDPVQPGSLGVEAMCQLLQFHLIEQDAGAGLRRPRFEPVLPGREVSWRYRGQVVPTDGQITVEMDIVDEGDDEYGRYAVGEAWLWVDGKRIYHIQNLGMRVVESATEE